MLNRRDHKSTETLKSKTETLELNLLSPHSAWCSAPYGWGNTALLICLCVWTLPWEKVQLNASPSHDATLDMQFAASELVKGSQTGTVVQTGTTVAFASVSESWRMRVWDQSSKKWMDTYSKLQWPFFFFFLNCSFLTQPWWLSGCMFLCLRGSQMPVIYNADCPVTRLSAYTRTGTVVTSRLFHREWSSLRQHNAERTTSDAAQRAWPVSSGCRPRLTRLSLRHWLKQTLQRLATDSGTECPRLCCTYILSCSSGCSPSMAPRSWAAGSGWGISGLRRWEPWALDARASSTALISCCCSADCCQGPANMSRKEDVLPLHLFIGLSGLNAAARITTVTSNNIQIHLVHVVVQQLLPKSRWITWSFFLFFLNDRVVTLSFH